MRKSWQEMGKHKSVWPSFILYSKRHVLLTMKWDLDLKSMIYRNNLIDFFFPAACSGPSGTAFKWVRPLCFKAGKEKKERKHTHTHTQAPINKPTKTAPNQSEDLLLHTQEGMFYMSNIQNPSHHSLQPPRACSHLRSKRGGTLVKNKERNTFQTPHM